MSAVSPRPGRAAGSIDLWQIDCRALPPGFLDRCNAVLAPEEQEHADRHRQPADRLRFRVGRGLTRLVSARLTGIAAETLVWSRQDRGKPYWRNADCPFNVSHSGDFVYLAAGGPDPLGVDIQIDEPRIDAEAIADYAMSEAEKTFLAERRAEERRAAFFALWVLREAALKATGQGVFDLHRGSALPLPPHGGWGQSTGLGDVRLWRQILPAPRGYAAALAVLSGESPPDRVVARSVTDLTLHV